MTYEICLKTVSVFNEINGYFILKNLFVFLSAWET